MKGNTIAHINPGGPNQSGRLEESPNPLWQGSLRDINKKIKEDDLNED